MPQDNVPPTPEEEAEVPFAPEPTPATKSNTKNADTAAAASSIPHKDSNGEEDFAASLLDLLGPAYARHAQFWKGCFWSSIPQGVVLAFVLLGFKNLYDWLAKITWLTHEYEEALEFIPDLENMIQTFTELPFANLLEGALTEAVAEGGGHGEFERDSHVVDILKLGNGEWWYVGLLAAAGLGVGLIKTVWTLLVPTEHAYPQKMPGFIYDVRELRAHSVYLPIPVLLCSAISIGCGASCGPEAPLGTTGTALGQILAARWRVGRHEAVSANKADKEEKADSNDKESSPEAKKPSFFSTLLPDFSNDREYCVMDGISAAFGALFPSQYLGPMLVIELGGHWGPGGKLSLTETVARTGLSASISYTIFVTLADKTLLEQIPLPAAAYDLLPKVDPIEMLQGALLGIICGLVGCLGLVIVGVGRAIGDKVWAMLDSVGDRVGLKNATGISLGLLLTPVVGGALVGLLCVAAPLILSDGGEQLGAVISLGKVLGSGTLVVTGLLKLLAVSISLGFGFVGGPVFPFIFTGICVGTVAHLLFEDSMNILVSVPACMVAVPCAFVPAVFTFTTLASMVLALGGAATSPVFFACFCSYTTVCGFGIVQDFVVKKMGKGNGGDNKEGGNG